MHQATKSHLKLPCVRQICGRRGKRLSRIHKEIDQYFQRRKLGLECILVAVTVQKKRKFHVCGSWSIDIRSVKGGELSGTEAELREALGALKGDVEGIASSFVRIEVLCRSGHRKGGKC